VDSGGREHGFSGAPGHLQSLDAPAAVDTRAEAINDWGQVAGSYTDGSGNTHGFVDRSGEFTTVDIPGAKSTTVSGINDWGQLVGSYTDSSGTGHGFVQTFGRVETLDAPSATRTDAYGINNLGDVVGTAEVSTPNPGGGTVPGTEVWVAKPSFLHGNATDTALAVASAAGLSSPSDQQTLGSLLQSAGAGNWSHLETTLASVAGTVAKAPAPSLGGGLDNIAAAISGMIMDYNHATGVS